MEELYITPDDVFEHEIKGHKFELAPVDVDDYMANINLFTHLDNLNSNQRDRLKKFVASKIVRVDGEEFDKKQIHVIKPTIFFKIIDKLIEQVNLKEDEKIFHQDQ